MHEEIIQAALKLDGVRSAAIVRPPGTLATSTIESKPLQALVETLFRAAGELHARTKLGKVGAILVRTSGNQDLALIVHDEIAIALVCDAGRSLAAVATEARRLFG